MLTCAHFKKSLATGLALATVLTTPIYATNAPTEPASPTESITETLPPPVPKPKDIEVEATGAILIDELSGRVLWEKNGFDPLAMASTTKIMTLIVALENADLSDMVKISSKAASQPRVKMNLSAGEEIKLEYLLYALMLQSFNDSAVAIAEHVGGNVESFCKMMTDKAKQIGAYDTIFETPSGLDKGEHHSTAYDMAIIARYAMTNPEFIRITNTKSAEVTSNKKTYSLINKNRLLYEMPGAKGVKTGFTNKAGHCFVGAVERDGMGFISVVLGSGWGGNRHQKWIDTKKILNHGFEHFKYYPIVTEPDTGETIAVERSRQPELGLVFDTTLHLPLSAYEHSTLRIEVEAPTTVKAPVTAGQQLGVAKIYIDNALEHELPVLAASDAKRHDLKTSIEKILNAWFSMAGEADLVLPEFTKE